MPDFWRAIQAGAGLAPDERARHFMADFVNPHLQDLRLAGLNHLDAANLESWFSKVDPILPAIRQLDGRLRPVWARNIADYSKFFPDFDRTRSPVYFMPSFLRFDAHLEPHSGILPLFIGLDGIVMIHKPDTDLGVLLSHELFHCYHAQKCPKIMLDADPPMFANLWIEGLATYVSERLHPNASLLAVLLDAEDLRARGDSLLGSWSRELLAKIDSTAPGDIERFFSSGWKGSEPARSGYFVGLMVARRLGSDVDLPALAALQPAQLRPLIVRELTVLAGRA